MVPAGGFEPPNPKVNDFKSFAYTAPPHWQIKMVGQERLELSITPL